MSDPAAGSARHRNRRSWLLAGVATAIVGVVVLVLVWTGGDGGRSPNVLPADARRVNLPVPSGHATDLVVHDGDTVIGSSEIEAVPGRPVRFCDPGAAVGIVADRAYHPCPGITVVGVDLTRLAKRFTQGGIGHGSATLVGVYRKGTLTVTAQGPPAPDRDRYRSQYIPCRPPAGGWAPITQTLGVGNPYLGIRLLPAQRYGAHHPQFAVKVAALRASPTAVVAYVLSAGGAATTRIRAALSPTYPNDLCVATSRFTRSQVIQAQAALRAKTTFVSGGPSLYAWDELGSGDDLGPDAQLCVTFDVPIMSAGLAKYIDVQPAGIIEVTTFLRPVASLHRR